MDTSKPLKTHETCPDCNANGALTVWSNSSYCHSCGKKRYMEETKVHTPLTEVSAPYRSIPKSSVEKYQIKTGINEKGEHVYRKYSYPDVGDKYRYLPKDFSKNTGFRNNRLFGMDKFNAGSSQYLTIVEGEDDVPSAYYMLGEKYPVVGIPGAAISETLLKECFAWMNSFKYIVVCTDSDSAGNKAADKIASVFPNKVYRVKMTTHKDPNEFLVAGHEKDFFFAWTNREKHIPQGIYNTPTQFKEILRQTELNDYLPTTISDLNDVIKGLMRGHLLVLTGPEGQGKTEIMRKFEYDILKNHPETPIAVLHMEESKRTCLMSYACYELKTNVRDPDHMVPMIKVEEAIDTITKNEKLYLFDFGIDEDPLAILDKVRYFATACGCHYIFIDPIQQLSYGKDKDSTEEQTLSQIAVQLERLATDLNVGIILSSHVNDDGQTRSSRMIGKSASVRIDLTRDHMHPDPEVRNTTKLSVSKNRPVGRTGYGGTLTFDPSSFTIGEMS